MVEVAAVVVAAVVVAAVLISALRRARSALMTSCGFWVVLLLLLLLPPPWGVMNVRMWQTWTASDTNKQSSHLIRVWSRVWARRWPTKSSWRHLHLLAIKVLAAKHEYWYWNEGYFAYRMGQSEAQEASEHKDHLQHGYHGNTCGERENDRIIKTKPS